MSATDQYGTSEWSPPTIPRGLRVIVLVVTLLWIAYTLVIIQEILLGLLVVFLFGCLYVGWRFLAAIEAIAVALQRIAGHYERTEE